MFITWVMIYNLARDCTSRYLNCWTSGHLLGLHYLFPFLLLTRATASSLCSTNRPSWKQIEMKHIQIGPDHLLGIVLKLHHHLFYVQNYYLCTGSPRKAHIQTIHFTFWSKNIRCQSEIIAIPRNSPIFGSRHSIDSKSGVSNSYSRTYCMY